MAAWPVWTQSAAWPSACSSSTRVWAPSTLSSTTSTRRGAVTASGAAASAGALACEGAAASGRRTVNRAPWPMPALATATSPWCRSTRWRTSDRPIPSPPRACSPWACTWANMSKMVAMAAPDRPMPSSLTVIAIRSCCAPSSCAVTAICPPALEYLDAFVSRLVKIWVRRVLSASSQTGSAGSCTVSCWAAPSNRGRTLSMACSMAGCRAVRSRRSTILPELMRPISIRSSTSSASWPTWRSITWRDFCQTSCRSLSFISCTALMMGASGPRSSCARVARYSFLRRSACCSSASLARSWRAARSRRVMSVAIVITDSTWPAASKAGMARVTKNCSSPRGFEVAEFELAHDAVADHAVQQGPEARAQHRVHAQFLIGLADEAGRRHAGDALDAGTDEQVAALQVKTADHVGQVVHHVGQLALAPRRGQARFGGGADVDHRAAHAQRFALFAVGDAPAAAHVADGAVGQAKAVLADVVGMVGHGGRDGGIDGGEIVRVDAVAETGERRGHAVRDAEHATVVARPEHAVGPHVPVIDADAGRIDHVVEHVQLGQGIERAQHGVGVGHAGVGSQAGGGGAARMQRMAAPAGGGAQRKAKRARQRRPPRGDSLSYRHHRRH